jgi:transposase
MNAFPQEQSVLVIDNCRIHHNEALQELVNGAGMFFRGSVSYCIDSIYIGCILLYLPPYSPDINPIEESFSTCELRLSVSHLECYLCQTSESIYASTCWRDSRSQRPSLCAPRSLRMYHCGNGSSLVCTCRLSLTCPSELYIGYGNGEGRIFIVCL